MCVVGNWVASFLSIFLDFYQYVNLTFGRIILNHLLFHENKFHVTLSAFKTLFLSITAFIQTPVGHDQP